MNPEGGYTRQYRRMWDNPVFRNKQEASVFSWMKDAAQYKEARISTKFGPVSLGVGELLIAERTLSEDFNIHRNTLRSLLQRMLDDGMIEVIRDRCPHRAGTVVRIVNYVEYQGFGESSGPKEDRRWTVNGTEGGPKKDRRRTKNKEGNQGKEGKDLPVADATEPGEPAIPSAGSQTQPELVLSPSEPHAAPPVDLKAVIFGTCLSWLAGASGKPQDKLRPALGRLCSRYGDGAVLEVLQNAARASPVDPIAWIHEVIKRDYEEINGSGTYSRKREKISPHQALFEAGALVDAQIREAERLN